MEDTFKEFLLLEVFWLLLCGFSQKGKVIFLLIDVLLFLEDAVVWLLCYFLHLVAILVQTDAEACTFSFDILSKLLLSLVSLDLHGLYPRVEKLILLRWPWKLLLDLRWLLLLLYLLDDILQQFPLENSLQSISFDFVLKSLLQVLAVLLL